MSIQTQKPLNDAHERIGTVLAPDTRPIPRTPAEAPPAPHVPDVPGTSWYRRERWLAVQLVALIPILGAMFAPAAYRAPMCIVGGALIAMGTVMMLRHHQSSGGTRKGPDLQPTDRRGVQEGQTP